MRSGQLRIAFALFACGLPGLAGCGEEGAMGGLSAAVRADTDPPEPR